MKKKLGCKVILLLCSIILLLSATPFGQMQAYATGDVGDISLTVIEPTQVASTDGTNLLINPGGDAGNSDTGWANGSGTTIWDSTSNGKTGNYFGIFAQGYTSSTANRYQDVDVSNLADEIDAGTIMINLSGYYMKTGKQSSDVIKIQLQELDQDGNVIFETLERTCSTINNWESLAISEVAATGTRTVRVTLVGTINGNVILDPWQSLYFYAGFDDMSLTMTEDSSSPPTITSITDQSTDSGSILGPIAFMVDDADTDLNALTVSAHSSDQTLIKDANISVELNGQNGTITLSSENYQMGEGTITIAVSDGIKITKIQFGVTIYPVIKLGQNVIRNGDGTSLTGWTNPEGRSYSDGKKFIVGTLASGATKYFMYQDINITKFASMIDTGMASFVASCDTTLGGNFTVSGLDESGNVLWTKSSGSLIGTGTRTIRVQIGGPINSTADNVSLILPNLVLNVTYNSQGGSAISAQTTNYDTIITEPAAPTRTGYTFNGWYQEAGCSNEWDYALDKVTKNITLYAKWTLNNYTVTYNSQGGNAVSGQTTDYDTTIIAPVAPIRMGYTFEGWYKEAMCSNAWDYALDKVTDNTTLYAKWTVNNFAISFDSQGGSAISAQTTNYDTIITEPAAPARTGYTFKGWYQEAGCSNEWDYALDKVTKNITLYAKWTLNNYTVTYNSQGGNAVSGQTTDYDTTIIAPVAPIRMGYTFEGWYKEAMCSNAWDYALDKVTDNTTLYAKWTVNNFAISFDSEGGSTVNSQTTDYDTIITAPVTPARVGYTFGGWYKDETCTNAWDFALDKVTENTTLYAKWTLINYTVTFNTGNGSTVNSQITNQNTTVTAPVAPTRTGYIFDGWYKDAAYTNAWNYAIDTVTADITVYAKWSAILVNSIGLDKTSVDIAKGKTLRLTATVVPVNALDKEVEWSTSNSKVVTVNADGMLTAENYGTATITVKAKGGSGIVATCKVTVGYLITYQLNGGTNTDANPSVYNNIKVKFKDPNRKGYTFKGWYTDKKFKTKITSIKKSTKKDYTVYAKWEKVSVDKASCVILVALLKYAVLRMLG